MLRGRGARSIAGGVRCGGWRITCGRGEGGVVLVDGGQRQWGYGRLNVVALWWW
jgi:hypothetical protein